MKRGLIAILLLLSASACVRKSELDQAQQENKELRGQVAQLEQRISELQSDLKDATAKLSTAETALARKPDMPVKVGFRRALLGPGYVAVFSTTIKQDFPVLVTVKSKALGTSKQIPLHLSQAVPSELGHAEGVAIDPGDEITVTNSNYEPLAVVFSTAPS